MKNKKNQFLFYLLYVIYVLTPVLSYSQDNGQNPDPFDDTPPDYVPEASIDKQIVLMVLIAICMALYFLVLKKDSKKATQE